MPWITDAFTWREKSIIDPAIRARAASRGEYRAENEKLSMR
jgi:hypothetical protein